MKEPPEKIVQRNLWPLVAVYLPGALIADRTALENRHGLAVRPICDHALENVEVCTGGKRIAHVHISENDRSTPGEGHVRWDETFSTLAEVGYDGWLMVEAFGASLPEIAGATCIWRQMFPNEEYLATHGLKFMKDSVAKYWKK